jgi:hypothetical protein
VSDGDVLDLCLSYPFDLFTAYHRECLDPESSPLATAFRDFVQALRSAIRQASEAEHHHAPCPPVGVIDRELLHEHRNDFEEAMLGAILAKADCEEGDPAAAIHAFALASSVVQAVRSRGAGCFGPPGPG